MQSGYPFPGPPQLIGPSAPTTRCRTCAVARTDAGMGPPVDQEQPVVVPEQRPEPHLIPTVPIAR